VLHIRLRRVHTLGITCSTAHTGEGFPASTTTEVPEFDFTHICLCEDSMLPGGVRPCTNVELEPDVKSAKVNTTVKTPVPVFPLGSRQDGQGVTVGTLAVPVNVTDHGEIGTPREVARVAD
jgi:hypothetical protein